MKWIGLCTIVLVVVLPRTVSAQQAPVSVLQLSRSVLSPGQLEVLRVTARDLAGLPLAGARVSAVVKLKKHVLRPSFPRTDSRGRTSASFRVPAVQGVVGQVSATISNGYLTIPLAARFRVAPAAASGGAIVLTAHAYPTTVTAPDPVWIVAYVHDHRGTSASGAQVAATVPFHEKKLRLSAKADSDGIATILIDTTGAKSGQTVRATLSATWKSVRVTGSAQFAVRPAAAPPTAVPTAVPTVPPTATPIPTQPAPPTVAAAVSTNTPVPSPTSRSGGATVTAMPTDTPVPTPTQTATPLPSPTATPTAIRLPSPTATPTATPLPTSTPDPTSTPRPTATPIPTDTPAPTATPVPIPTQQPLPCGGSSDQCHLLDLLNTTRAQYGRGSLTLIQNATTDQHAADEASCTCIFHQDARFPNESFPYGGFWAENVGAGPSTDSVHSLMMSEGTSTCSQGTLSHACNIIDPRWTQVALGIATSGGYFYIVEDFR